MTVSGESVTRKEILPVSYVIMPGVLAEKSLPGQSEWFLDGIRPENGEPSRFVLQFQDFYFQHDDMTEAATATRKLSTTTDFILMQFCLRGSCGFTDESGKVIMGQKPAEYNILCLPPKRMLNFAFEPGKSETVAIFLEKRFWLKHIPADHLLFQEVQANTLKTLYAANLALNPNLHQVLQDIIACAFGGHLKRLYTQAKIIELLALHIAQLEEENNPVINLKQSEIDKMLEVKDIIDQNFKEPLSLGNLARQVVTNEQYLKKHFKIVFGCTVFNYILKCRMEKAKQLLLTGEHKIAEVAEHTGYKHATHFTNAFKKFFGYLPQKIKGKMEMLVLGLEVCDYMECSGLIACL